MANVRLENPAVRIWLAFPEAFKDWENPTAAEFNANPTNDKAGLIFDITCAVNQDGSNFDLADPDVDDSLSFCQVAGSQTATSLNPEITLEIFRSEDPDAEDTANLAFSLLAWKGVEYFAILSVGEEPGEDVAIGHRVKMARMGIDFPSDIFGSGEKVRLSQAMAARGDVNWNHRVAA